MWRARGGSAWCWHILAQLSATDILARVVLESLQDEVDRQECLSHLLHRIVEEDDVGGAPDGGGDGAVGLAGHDDLEKFRRRGEVGPEQVASGRRQRVCHPQLL